MSRTALLYELAQVVADHEARLRVDRVRFADLERERARLVAGSDRFAVGGRSRRRLENEVDPALRELGVSLATGADRLAALQVVVAHAALAADEPVFGPPGSRPGSGPVERGVYRGGADPG